MAPGLFIGLFRQKNINIFRNYENQTFHAAEYTYIDESAVRFIGGDIDDIHRIYGSVKDILLFDALVRGFRFSGRFRRPADQVLLEIGYTIRLSCGHGKLRTSTGDHYGQNIPYKRRHGPLVGTYFADRSFFRSETGKVQYRRNAERRVHRPTHPGQCAPYRFSGILYLYP